MQTHPAVDPLPGADDGPVTIRQAWTGPCAGSADGMKLSSLAVGVLTAALLVPAAPASAAGGITSPGAGEVVTADAVLPLRAVVEGPSTQPSELTLQAPGADEAQVVAVQTSPSGGELAYDFDTSCARVVCTGRVPARNGTWTVRLNGPTTDERTFDVRIPPAAPVDVAAARSESGVVVRWRLGAEPDLTGYAVRDASGAVRGRTGTDVCDVEGVCRVEVPEQGRSWSVVAFRTTCPGCAEVLASPASEPASVSGAAPAAAPVVVPEPSPSPSPAAQRREVPDQGAAFTRAFGTGRAAAAPAPAAPRAAQPAPVQPDGTFGTELGYAAPDVALATPRSPASRAQDALASVPESDRLRLLVLSSLMIGAAVWLRRWARRTIAD